MQTTIQHSVDVFYTDNYISTASASESIAQTVSFFFKVVVSSDHSDELDHSDPLAVPCGAVYHIFPWGLYIVKTGG